VRLGFEKYALKARDARFLKAVTISSKVSMLAIIGFEITLKVF
jgi:hypothetical protein